MHQPGAAVALLKGASAAAADVFRAILTRGPISRIDVARLLGLSQAAVTKAVGPLLEVGLVSDELEVPRDGQPGRPANPLMVVADALLSIGIKVNADEIVGVVTDLRTTVLAANRRALKSTTPQATIDAIAATVDDLIDALGDRADRLCTVGVSVSGDVDAHSGVVRESAIMGWTAVPLGTLLSARLERDVLIENDVRALTIGEHWFGVGVGTDLFAIVTIGRGIGSGLHVNGEVVEGAYGVAGEIGHLPLTSPDRICPCGRRGCVEAVAGTPAIVAEVSRAHGRDLSIGEIVELAHEGDPAAVQTFEHAATTIGTAIATLVNLTGPELVIIGGEAVSNFDLFERHLRASFASHAFGAAGRCQIVTRPHTFEDWARGASAAAIRQLAENRF
ncbi:Sugar kinase of the NBD/HSP70 family, may contain an N-terminal HTH domain [Asanoa hainanensis]|uniref:Sugar kinase of the NBD/HSP70 family, may contain an N-terminal HTH domain n=1 Tax=Asanoa hainanensis TaxID=560556 RepID=A0A239NL06_9ACTN|nr:ROK family transcriptional regulator [Asanoa hainanensis]SNT55272.1 Sugar kinase of the NBD/HSP70 family, may contain an N-terminal HTH domain [Asanoa hainanensis]